MPGSSMPSGSAPSPGAETGTAGSSGAPSGTAGQDAGGGIEVSYEDRTLEEALEQFERAGSRGSTGQQTAGVETDFPMALPSGGSGSGGEESMGAAGTLPGSPGAPATAGTEVMGAEAGASAGQPGSMNGRAQTAGEKVAVLDRRLEESYGQFEGMILRERDYVRDRDNARGADVETSAGGAGGGAVIAGAVGGERLEPITGSGSGNRPGSAPDPNRAGDYQVAAIYAPPPDIPDGSDDDVVARQLREAATRESDPELREKLWDEYRKYKNQAKAN